MAYYMIENTISGHVLGIYPGQDEDDALDTMARDAGYADYATLDAEIPSYPGEILVTEVSKIYHIEHYDCAGYLLDTLPMGTDQSEAEALTDALNQTTYDKSQYLVVYKEI